MTGGGPRLEAAEGGPTEAPDDGPGLTAAEVELQAGTEHSQYSTEGGVEALSTSAPEQTPVYVPVYTKAAIRCGFIATLKMTVRKHMRVNKEILSATAQLKGGQSSCDINLATAS